MAYSTTTSNNSNSASSQSSQLRAGTYKGFSTLSGGKTNQLYDVELIKQDLINHFYTRKGERVMNPEFGSIIWDMLYEPLDDANKEIIIEDCHRIISSDPRVELDRSNVMEAENGLRIEVGITVMPFNQQATMQLLFERETI
jgi:phage baseplate assembly protein W